MSLIDCKQGSHFLRQKSKNRFLFEEFGCAVVKWENGARKESCGQEKKEMGRPRNCTSVLCTEIGGSVVGCFSF